MNWVDIYAYKYTNRSHSQSNLLSSYGGDELSLIKITFRNITVKLLVVDFIRQIALETIQLIVMAEARNVLIILLQKKTPLYLCLLV